MVIRKNGEKCTCGRKGCFETYASAIALIRETKKAMTKHPESKLWEIGSAENVSAKTAFVYKDKDKTAKKIVKDYIKSLACGISNVANIFRPQVILIGGGVCAEGDNLLKPLQKEVNKQIYGGKLCENVPVRIASLGNKAGLLGAAALVM
jgi:glucokinase